VGRAADIVDVFVYVVVLNLFVEYSPTVLSETFTLSLLTAVLLEAVLEIVGAGEEAGPGAVPLGEHPAGHHRRGPRSHRRLTPTCRLRRCLHLRRDPQPGRREAPRSMTSLATSCRSQPDSAAWERSHSRAS